MLKGDDNDELAYIISATDDKAMQNPSSVNNVREMVLKGKIARQKQFKSCQNLLTVDLGKQVKCIETFEVPPLRMKKEYKNRLKVSRNHPATIQKPE